jgi:hypothetical protein
MWVDANDLQIVAAGGASEAIRGIIHEDHPVVLKWSASATPRRCSRPIVAQGYRAFAAIRRAPPVVFHQLRVVVVSFPRVTAASRRASAACNSTSDESGCRA